MDDFTDNMPCDKCFYNRLMKAWGQTFEACYYSLDTGNEIYGSPEVPCSGFEEKEKQLQLNL